MPAVLIRPVTDGKRLFVPGWEPSLFGASPINERVSVTTRPWPISWVFNGRVRHATVPEDYRFAVRLRSFLNRQPAQRLSAIHGLLYETHGGLHVALTCSSCPVILPFTDVTPAEADSVALAVALASGTTKWKAYLMHLALSHFAYSTWT